MRSSKITFLPAKLRVVFVSAESLLLHKYLRKNESFRKIVLACLTGALCVQCIKKSHKSCDTATLSPLLVFCPKMLRCL